MHSGLRSTGPRATATPIPTKKLLSETARTECPRKLLAGDPLPARLAESLKPGESAEASGAILFTEEALEEAVKKRVQNEWIRGAGR